MPADPGTPCSAGTIFKRFDTTKLFTVTCQDVVERFHLGLAMLFVMAEEMDNTSSWLPNMGLLWKCTQIFLAEVVIDVTKHAVLGKFNEIRPGVYREYTRVSTCIWPFPSIHTVQNVMPYSAACLLCLVNQRDCSTFMMVSFESGQAH